MKIGVFGIFADSNKVKDIFLQNVDIVYWLDNNPQRAGKEIDGKPILSPYDFPKDLVDYIVVLINNYEVIDQELIDFGIPSSQIINFNDPNLDYERYKDIFVIDHAEKLRQVFRIKFLENKIDRLEQEIFNYYQNIDYEILDRQNRGIIRIPKVHSVEDTYNKIINEKCSLSRYGDGEFQIILGKAKDIYQNDNNELASRLKNILTSNVEGHIVAIADDYGAMEGLREENKSTIRRYMTREKRKEHYALLDMSKEYYNAYISRPYVIYPYDQLEAARKRFMALKLIWEKKNVLFIEGDKTRMGVGNDLFANAASIERIVAPNENAFNVYDDILSAALKYGNNKLILIALGPTATVLAYDLAVKGYWALDIGHLDLEYEWFLKGKGYSYIPQKYNNEVLGDINIIPISDSGYSNSIVCKIGI